MSHATLTKPRLKTSAMIASIAGEGQATRPAPFGQALVELARNKPDVIGMTADLGKSTDLHLFAKAFPERYYQMGMAEQLLMGAAAGLAHEGAQPFVTTYAVFATRRAYDFMHQAIAEDNLDVKIVCALPGLTTGYGPSHQAAEDLALMRAMPNMTVIEPSGPDQVRKAVAAIAAYDGPVYLRMKRADGSERDLGGDDSSFAIGRARVLRQGPDGLLLCTGRKLGPVCEAADRLAAEGIRVSVADVATLKPLDPAIVDLARRAPVVVTAENHSIIGGLGSAVAELLMESDVRPRFARIGVRDVFAEGGTTPYLFERYGLTADAIHAAFSRERSRGT